MNGYHKNNGSANGTINGFANEFANGSINGIKARLNGKTLEETYENGYNSSTEIKLSPYDKAKQSADYLLASTKYRPKIAVICGTGLGALSELLEDPVTFRYGAIPHFPDCTAPGHA